MDRDRDPVPAGLEGGLQRADDREVGVEPGQRPLALEGLEQAGEVARRRGQLRWLDLDVVEPDDRVDREGPDVEVLADDLAMDLALGRDVDEDVAADRRGAGQPAVRARPLSLRYVVSSSLNPDRCPGSEVMPCLANVPMPCVTWQRPQMPRPPQTESMSTPRDRAASSTVVPSANRPRRPDGVKMTSGSTATIVPTSAGRGHESAIDAAPADLALGRWFAERSRSSDRNPGRCP